MMKEFKARKKVKKERRYWVQKELEVYKISYRMGVLKDGLKILDSEANIVQKKLEGWKVDCLNP